MKRGKEGIVSDYLPWLLIGLLTLVIFVAISFILKGKGISILEAIKNLFTGR
jgi:hypothetical protein